MSKPRAFVLEESKYDSSSAEDFARVTYVYGPGEIRPSIFDPTLHGAVWDKLESYNYDPIQDYLVLTGDMIPVSILLSVAMRIARTHGVKVLVWHASDRIYKELVL